MSLHLSNYSLFEEPAKDFTPVVEERCPVLCQGAQEIDTLCPVSKLTGHRTPLLSLLGMVLGDKESRLIDAILSELPVVQSIQGVTDEERIEMLVSRYHDGTFAEHDKVVKQLSSIVDVLFPDQSEVKDQIDNNIEFKQSDAPDSNSDAV